MYRCIIINELNFCECPITIKTLFDRHKLPDRKTLYLDEKKIYEEKGLTFHESVKVTCQSIAMLLQLIADACFIPNN